MPTISKCMATLILLTMWAMTGRAVGADPAEPSPEQAAQGSPIQFFDDDSDLDEIEKFDRSEKSKSSGCREVLRQHHVLFLRLGNCEFRTYVNFDWGDSSWGYLFSGIVKGTSFYLIRVNFYESNAYLLVDGGTGTETWIDAPPSFRPMDRVS